MQLQELCLCILVQIHSTCQSIRTSFPTYSCFDLQRQYVQLQELYQQLKAQKITELEGLLEEQVG